MSETRERSETTSKAVILERVTSLLSRYGLDGRDAEAAVLAGPRETIAVVFRLAPAYGEKRDCFDAMMKALGADPATLRLAGSSRAVLHALDRALRGVRRPGPRSGGSPAQRRAR
jgi:hypothetical protein